MDPWPDIFDLKLFPILPQSRPYPLDKPRDTSSIDPIQNSFSSPLIMVPNQGSPRWADLFYPKPIDASIDPIQPSSNPVILPGPYPEWVNLGSFLRRPCGRRRSPDRRSLASGVTPNGDCVYVSFRAVAPPGTSRLFFDWVRAQGRGVNGTSCSDAKVLAAHRNSLLLSFVVRFTSSRELSKELFVLQAPSVHLTRIPSGPHNVPHGSMGIMCGEDDGKFVVAHLAVYAVISRRGDPDPVSNSHCPVTAELSLMFSQEASWRTTKILEIHHPDGRGMELVWWRTDAVITFGNTICWVDYLRGILLCNVLSPDPVLRYLPLPVNPFEGATDPSYGGRGVYPFRNVCVTKDGGALKFVDVACYCWFSGRPDYSSMPSAITSWTLSSDRLAWVQDGNVKCDEFLALSKQINFPYDRLEFPVVDMRDPQIIFVALREEPAAGSVPKRWLLVAVDMSSKTLNMPIPSTYMLSGEDDNYYSDTASVDPDCYSYELRIACQFSKYLNLAVSDNSDEDEAGGQDRLALRLLGQRVGQPAADLLVAPSEITSSEDDESDCDNAHH